MWDLVSESGIHNVDAYESRGGAMWWLEVVIATSH